LWVGRSDGSRDGVDGGVALCRVTEGGDPDLALPVGI